MPIFATRAPGFKTSKDREFNWDNFRKGLNTLLKETEIEPNELAQADNLILIGKGVPTKRWGTAVYYKAGATGSIRGLEGYYKTGGTPELLAVTDWGLLTKKNGTSYTEIAGASWASGSHIEMAQLSDKQYIVSDNRELVSYDGTSLTSFPTIATPTGAYATQISGASGTNTYSYRVSVTTDVGETLASTAATTGDQPQELTDGAVKLTWTTPSAASGTLKNFNVYGRDEGDERFLGSVDWQSTVFVDNGDAIPQSFTFPPLADSTGGVRAKFIKRFQDRLVYAGIDGDPSKIIVSGREPLHERIDLASGGNYLRIEADAGDDITGLEIFENKIIVFKERSIWQVSLTQETVGNFSVTIPTGQLITQSHGCISGRTIAFVENDIFFLSRKGVYALGYEPNILSVLRTNEISAKVRPFFEDLTIAQKMGATASYTETTYVISFPGKDQSMTYDRERLAWMGPHTFDANIQKKFYDSSDNEIFVYGEDDGPDVIRMDESYGDDSGTAIKTVLRTRKEDYKDWSLFKTIKDVYLNFRNVTGSVDVNIRLEERDGSVITAKSFDVQTTSGNAGWGADMFGSTLFGDSESSGGGSDTNDLVRLARLNKAARSVQLEIKTEDRNDNYELLAVRSRAKPISRGYTNPDWIA